MPSCCFGFLRAARRRGTPELRCDWCRKPLFREVPIRSSDGSLPKRLVADAHVSLRLPGASEAVTLHSGAACRAEYVAARALRCGRCSEPLTDANEVVLVEGWQKRGGRTYLHRECASYEEDALPPAAPRPRSFSEDPRGVPPAAAPRPRSSSAPGDGKCFQCGKALKQEHVSVGPAGTASAGARKSSDATTTLQLPGFLYAVTLCEAKGCVDQYVEANALRCHQCRRPIRDQLKMVRLPWSSVSATLHRGCEEAYVEASAARCSSCRKPIPREGVRVRSRGRDHFLHRACEANFQA